MQKLYAYAQWLSLDVVAGAFCFLGFLSRFYSVYLPLSVYFALGCAIWLIYTTDHLLDVRPGMVARSPRRRFHRTYFHWLIVGAALVLMGGLVSAFFLPESILRAGMLLAACCVGYLLLTYFVRRLWIKELMVAIGYAGGIFLGPLVVLQEVTPSHWISVAQLAVLALFNLVIFSWYDLEDDRQEGFQSLVSRLGAVRSRLLIHGMAMGGLALAGYRVMVQGDGLQWVYFLATMLLYSVFLFPALYRPADRFRLVGDGVFFIPGFFLLL